MSVLTWGTTPWMLHAFRRVRHLTAKAPLPPSLRAPWQGHRDANVAAMAELHLIGGLNLTSWIYGARHRPLVLSALLVDPKSSLLQLEPLVFPIPSVDTLTYCITHGFLQQSCDKSLAVPCRATRAAFGMRPIHRRKLLEVQECRVRKCMMII